MASAWRHWRARRHLATLLEQGERVGAVERLAVGGWWVLTDRALYAITARGTSALPRQQIRSVESRVGTFHTVTVISHASRVMIGDLDRRSAIAAELLRETSVA